MGFFGRSDDGDPAQAESLKRVERGGIPPRAEERLRGLAGEGSLFTSGLSVYEFALLDRLGPRPLAQVMGASVVRAGWQYLPALDPGKLAITGSMYQVTPTGRALQNVYTEPSLAQVRNYKWQTQVVCVLDVLSDAWNMARRRALDRLREEATHVGADAVVGVHLKSNGHDLVKGTIEYVVTGTAIRLPDSRGASAPMLTALSGQDYWQLHRAGQEPVALVATTAVMFASPSRAARLHRLRTTRENQELAELSTGFHTARETVRTRLRDQVSAAEAAGAVGVEFSHSVRRESFALASSIQTMDRHGWHRGRFGLPYRVSGRGGVNRDGWMITMHAAGTAIRARGDSSPIPVKTAIQMGQR